MFESLQTLFWMFTIFLFGVIHIALATAVKRDADRLLARNECLFLIGPHLWAFACFLGGITPVVAYWAIHYSTLKPKT